MQDALDIEVPIIDVDDTIPSDLYERVASYHHALRGILVEAKTENGRWISTRKRMRWEERPPIAAEEICRFVCTSAAEYSENHNYDEYRAVLSLWDAGTKSIKRKYCILKTVIGPDGDLQITDDHVEAFTQRDHMELLYTVVDRLQHQNETLFANHMTLVDKMNETLDRNISMSERHAAGLTTVGESIGGVVNAATQTLHNAARLYDKKEQESTVVQLAKMDQQGKQAQINFAMGLLNKVGGPLVKQLSSVFGDDKKKALPEKTAKPSKASSDDGPSESPSSDDASEESTTNETSAETNADTSTNEKPASTVTKENVGECLIAWRAKLTTEQRDAVRAIIGDAHYTAIDTAANSAEAHEALSAFVSGFRKLEQENEDEAAGKLIGLHMQLGEALSNEFGELLAVVG